MSELILFLPKLVLILAMLAGVCLTLLGLPGNFLILGGIAIYALVLDFVPAGNDSKVILISAIVIVSAEILEFVIGSLGGKAAKVSNGSIFCSIIGGLLGAFIGVPVFLIGSFIGLLLGVFLGAFLYEWIVQRNFVSAFRAGLAVFLSRMIALFFKASIAIGLSLYLLTKIF